MVTSKKNYCVFDAQKVLLLRHKEQFKISTGIIINLEHRYGESASLQDLEDCCTVDY